MVILRGIGLALTLAVSVGSATSVHAAPMTWHFNGANAFGGTISGSFDFDADSTTFSNIGVTTSGGSLPSASFNHPTAFADSSLIDLVNGPFPFFGLYELLIELSSAMSNNGGIIEFKNVFVGVCGNNDCGFADTGDYATSFSGTISTMRAPEPAPEPATIALVGLGLAGLGAFRRRRPS